MEKDDRQSSGIFRTLVRGDFGLAVTFWGWGVFGGFLLASLLTSLLNVISGVSEDELLALLFTCWAVYILTVFVGVWRAGRSGSLASVVSKLFIAVMLVIIAMIVFIASTYTYGK